jgi:Skp family chaperone for outer membrane proteins
VAVAGLAIAVTVTGFIQAQTPGGGAPVAGGAAPAAGRDVAVFNVAKVMKEFQKWQFYAQEMNKVRTAEATRLGQLQEGMTKLKADIEKETVAAQKDVKEKQLREMVRQYEDLDREVRKRIDEQSSKHLKELHDDINLVVQKVSERNGFGIVFAYPDATTEQEKTSPLYYELKLRPPAAMPFFVSPNCDITSAVIETLNKYRPSPGPVVPVGGTAPAGTPAPGTVPTPGVPAGRPGG